jgi:aspartokinase/homoserine dehydrogenase 1
VNNLLVMKFGGTSMGSAERMRVAADIIARQQQKQPVLVVVSAMSKVTDLLLDTLRRAELGDRAAVDAQLSGLLERHVAACEDLLGQPNSTTKLGEAAYSAVHTLVSEFQRIANGVLTATALG